LGDFDKLPGGSSIESGITNRTGERVESPTFLYGVEVATSKRFKFKESEVQLSLLEQEEELRRKLFLAVLVVFSVFFAGLICGAILGFFI